MFDVLFFDLKVVDPIIFDLIIPIIPSDIATGFCVQFLGPQPLTLTTSTTYICLPKQTAALITF